MASATSVPLKYLFEGFYKDGTDFKQSEDDVSIIDPKRSSFYDVNQNEVRYFGISNQSIWYGVDLETGCFFVGDYTKPGFGVGNPGPKPYKLVFWRQHTHNFNVEYEEQSHIVKYILGYEDADGVEHTILID